MLTFHVFEVIFAQEGGVREGACEVHLSPKAWYDPSHKLMTLPAVIQSFFTWSITYGAP